MKRFFGKKRKRTPNLPQQPISPDDPSDVATGSSGLRTDQDDDIGDSVSTGASSRIAIQDGASEFRAFSPVGIDGTGSGHELPNQTGDTEAGENDPAPEPFRTTERVHEGPVLVRTSGDVDKGTEERFGPLKITLGAIPAAYANDKGTVAVRNTVEGLLSGIVELEELFGSRPRDVAEQRRRSELRRNIETIKGQLQSLAEMPELRTDQVPRLLEDLREIIFDYQVMRQKEIDDQLLREMDPADATILNNFRSTPGAGHLRGNRIGCLKGTRSAILDEIGLWTRDFDKPPVYWLNGLAGTGKTTIAQTVAERAFADGKLGASFFCSRDFEDRSNLHFIFPTIAVQLARKYPDFRSLFVPLVRSDPGIAYESLYDQLRRLIVRPLQESAISTVVIIDALDECKDEEPASAILSVLGQFVSEIPNVKFFLTGRPEPRIREGFRLPLLADAADVFVLHGVERSQVDSDIRHFFRHKFSELARRRPGLDGWPAEEQIDVLCKRAAGLFVYAAATVKFVDKQNGNPRKQLDLLLRSPESTVREGKTKFRENTTLDSLYTSILQGAFVDDDDPDNDPKIRSVLGTMVLAANPLSPSTIAMLLGFDTEDVFPLLSSVQSLLIFQADVDYPVRPFHKSFPDFITDPDRCTSERFHVSPPSHHSQLLIGSLDLMNRMLEKNMCKLPDLAANSDVSDLKERIERYLDPALQYACRSWHTHLIAGSPSIGMPEITSALHQFLEKKFLFWLEVLSVLGAVRNAVDALQAAVTWLEGSPTLDLANECSRFVSAYFDIIDVSSPHIYHSALPSIPKTSMVWKLYEPHARSFTRVVHGAPSSWDSNTAATTRPSTIGPATWSLSNRFIAVASHEDVAIDVLDPATLQRLQSLGVERARRTYPNALAFSSNDRMLSCSGCDDQALGFVLTWDLQTGCVVSDVVFPEETIFLGGTHITYSICGKIVGILCRNRVTPIISIVDVVSGVYTHDIHPCTPWTYGIWAHGEFLRFATTKEATITIWEVGFTQGATHKEIETFSIPEDVDQARAFYQEAEERALRRTEFFPVPCRLAVIRDSVTSADELLVWGAQNSTFLLQETGASWHPKMTFSSDGRFFACSTTGPNVYLWEETSSGYTLIGKLPSSAQYSTPLLSPNGESIITFSGRTIQMWYTKGFTASSSILTQDPYCTGDFVLEFVRDGQSAVVARRGERLVTVIDLKSGLPQLTIDASMEIYGFRAIENTVVVIGDGRIITWNLPEENFVPHTRVGLESSTQTTVFSDESQNDTIAASISIDSHYIALLREDRSGWGSLHIFCPSTGLHNHTKTRLGTSIWLPPGKHEVWGSGMDQVFSHGYTPEGLKDYYSQQDIESISSACPWRSSRGYKATNDGWLIGPDGERLFMLPPSWRSYAAQRVWDGQFLALLQGSLPQPVILDLAP